MAKKTAEHRHHHNPHCRIVNTTAEKFELNKFLDNLRRKRPADQNLLINNNLKNLTTIADIKETMKLVAQGSVGYNMLTNKLRGM